MAVVERLRARRDGDRAMHHVVISGAVMQEAGGGVVQERDMSPGTPG